MVTQPTVAAQARRAAQRYERLAPVTNFYPNYGGDERTEPIAGVQPVRFQEIIPRYNLSTSATRTQGTGPLLYDLPSGWSTPHAGADRPRAASPRGDARQATAPAALQSAMPSVQPRSMAVHAYRRQVAVGAEINRRDESQSTGEGSTGLNIMI